MGETHTPGPWEVREGHSEVFGPAIYAHGAHELNPLAAVDHIDGTDADARLIAAAPDLLAALESLVDAGGDIADMAEDFITARDSKSLRNYGGNIASIARAAIAKARGEMP